MTTRDLFLICFAAASVIHGVQTVLSAKLLRVRMLPDRIASLDGIAIGVSTFCWQFGNFLSFLAWPRTFQLGQFTRDGALACFPLVFSYICLHLPERGPRTRFLIVLGRLLRYPLWPWTIVSIIMIGLADGGFRESVFWPDGSAYITLHIMLVYFVIFTVTTASYRGEVRASAVGALVRAYRANIVASFLGVTTFVLMLSGYWHVRIPFMQYVELAAMLTSVPFTISVAYRLYQFPFMDVFVREVLSGLILLGAFIVALALGTSPFWLVSCAIGLAYLKAPLTRWVERTFMGFDESVEAQEERIGNAIRGLTQLDEFGGPLCEILAREVEAEWVDIGSSPRTDALQRLEIAGSGLWLSVGPRIGGRQYMSRQLRILRSASLQMAAHHHQLSRHEMRELTARAQMRALQAQINPHFLFNTLNVLANLIHSNPEKAERVTEELADIFRYALESTRVEWVKLDDELRFLESYLAIEKARFEERLTYAFDVDERLRPLKIPPMILQPVVENAIKHGIGPKVDGGKVTISAKLDSDRVVIVVEDTGVGVQAGSRHRGAGIGLSNVRERLKHVYGDEGSLRLEESHPDHPGHPGTTVVIILPQPVGVHS